MILGKTPVYIHDFLRSKQVWFEGLLYQPASSSAKRARNARITGRQVAKAVLVRAGNSLLLAVLPASCRIDLDRLSQVVGSPVSEIRLATPEELLATFPDCEPGVVPPFGRLMVCRPWWTPACLKSATSSSAPTRGTKVSGCIFATSRRSKSRSRRRSAGRSRPVNGVKPNGRDENRRAG